MSASTNQQIRKYRTGIWKEWLCTWWIYVRSDGHDKNNIAKLILKNIAEWYIISSIISIITACVLIYWVTLRVMQFVLFGIS